MSLLRGTCFILSSLDVLSQVIRREFETMNYERERQKAGKMSHGRVVLLQQDCKSTGGN